MKRTECRKLSLVGCASQLPDSRYFIGLNRGTLEVGLYAPEGTDPQEPHEQDECYVILEGEGRFRMGDETVPFRPGDFFFVPAGVRTASSTSTSRSGVGDLLWAKGGEDLMRASPGRSSSPSS